MRALPRLVVAATTAALLFACAEGDTRIDGEGAGGAAGAPQGEVETLDLNDGHALYDYHCRSCHDEGGKGAQTSPDIRNPVKGYATHVVRTGRDEPEFSETMPDFDTKKLPDQGLTSILAYLAEAPHPEEGKGLYERFCRNCHGADAKGGRVDKDLVKEIGEGADEFLETVRKGHGKQAYDDVEEYMPKWSSSELSDAEVVKIVDYIGTLVPEGGLPPEEEEEEEEKEPGAG